jgi:hypothetical protein
MHIIYIYYTFILINLKFNLKIKFFICFKDSNIISKIFYG